MSQVQTVNESTENKKQQTSELVDVDKESRCECAEVIGVLTASLVLINEEIKRSNVLNAELLKLMREYQTLTLCQVP